MVATNDVRVTVRVDRTLKENADRLFERLGMNMTTALNVFLRKSVEENAIPFPVSIKPVKFGAGYHSDDVTSTFTEAVAKDIAVNLSRGFPVARYDAERGEAYLETAEGTREYVRNDG